MSDRAPDSGATEAWRAYDMRTWSHILLRHFFKKRGDPDDPVTVLLVTSAELARAAGAPPERGEEVRDALVATVLGQTRRDQGLLSDASDYPEWPSAPVDDEVPRFVPHLFFTCIAAAESSDDLEDEGSFVRRLRELSEDRLPDNQLAFLPTLWGNLETWLATGGNRTKYRQLRLPDPGGRTRIGHTVKLTFPDRRDQYDLSELLDGLRLAGMEQPPVGPVLALVAANRIKFSKRFLAEYEDFRRTYEASPHAAHLREHRFWAAVRDAALRGRGADDDVEGVTQPHVFGSVEDDRLHLFLLADGPTSLDPRFAAVELPRSYGTWTYALVPDGSELEVGMDAAARALLGGQIKVPRVSGQIEQGLLVFAEATHGALELVCSGDIEAASVALVRDDLAVELVRLLGASSARVQPSVYPGWMQVENVKFHRLPSEALVGSKLAKCWLLHEALFDTPIVVSGGVRADDGWLGYREVLPRVSSSNAELVTVVGRSGLREPLVPEGGDWTLPRRDLAGTFELVAARNDGTSTSRVLRFYTSTATETYQRPNDSGAWIVEGYGDTAALGSDVEITLQQGSIDAELLCERVTYLGQIVGEFVATRDEAAWCIVQFAGARLITLGRLTQGARPTHQVADIGARRRWRKMLLSSEPGNPQSGAARKVVGTHFPPTLPLIDRVTVDLPPPSSVATPRPPDARVARLVAILAARASARTGIPWAEWRQLLMAVFPPLSPEHIESVTRAWQEAGYLDVGSFARWRSLLLYARPPVLVAVRSGDAVRATLLGLALEATRARIADAATKAGVKVEERRSFCAFVPSTLTLRAADADTLARLAMAAGIDIRWLDLGFTTHARPPRGRTQAAPVGYTSSWVWTGWSLARDAPTGVSVVKWSRRDRPSYWTVTAGRLSVWSLDRNLARLWACAAVGTLSVMSGAGNELHAHHAYLPLPLARIVSVLGAALPGADVLLSSPYRYAFVSGALRNVVLNALRAAFPVEPITES